MVRSASAERNDYDDETVRQALKGEWAAAVTRQKMTDDQAAEAEELRDQA